MDANAADAAYATSATQTRAAGVAVVGSSYTYSSSTAAIATRCAGFTSTITANCLGDVIDATDSAVTLSLTLYASTYGMGADFSQDPSTGVVTTTASPDVGFYGPARPWNDATTSPFGRIKGLSYNYGYSVAPPVVTTANGHAYQWRYDITFDRFAAGLYEIWMDCPRLSSDRGANPQSFDTPCVRMTGVDPTVSFDAGSGGGDSAATTSDPFVVAVGFRPVVNVTQAGISSRDITAALAAATPTEVLNGVFSATTLTIQSTPGTTMAATGASAAIAKNVASIAGFSLRSGATLTPATGTAAALHTLVTAKTTTLSSNLYDTDPASSAGQVGTPAGGVNSVVFLPGAFVRSDGVPSVSTTIASVAGFKLSPSIFEVGSFTNPSALSGSTASGTALNYFAPTSIVALTLTSTGAAMPTGGYTWSTTASTGLFSALSAMPGASVAAPAGVALASSVAPTYSASSYVYTLDLATAKPPPGPLRVTVPSGAIVSTGDAPLLSAPTFVDINVGIPTAVTFVNRHYESMMDSSAVGTPTTVPLASGTSAVGSTLWALINMTFPSYQRDIALAFAESLGGRAQFTTTPTSITLPTKSANCADLSNYCMPIVYSSAASLAGKYLPLIHPYTYSTLPLYPWVRAEGTSVLVYYPVDVAMASTGATGTCGANTCTAASQVGFVSDSTGVSVESGIFTATINGVTYGNAVARNSAKIVAGTYPAAAAGILTPDGTAYSSSTLLWGAPLLSFLAQGTITRTLGTGVTAATSTVTVWGPQYGASGARAVFDSAAISWSGNAISFTVPTTGTDFSSVTPGTYKVTVDSTVAGSSRFTFCIGYDARFVPGVRASTQLLDEAFSNYVPRRGINGPFVTALNELRLRVIAPYGSGDASTSFPPLYSTATGVTSTLLKGVFAASDATFSNNLASALSYAGNTDLSQTFSATSTASIVALQSAADPTQKYVEYRVGVSGLPDGEYIFVLAANAAVQGLNAADTAATRVAAKLPDTQVRVIIDRQAPTPSPVLYSGTVPGVGVVPVVTNRPLLAPIPLPTTLFKDNLVPASALSVAVTSPSSTPNNHGLWLLGDSLSAVTLATARLYTDIAVRGPVGSYAVNVTATDEALNTASALFTVPIRVQPGILVTVIDKRGVQARAPVVLRTGSPASVTAATSTLDLDVLVDFDEPATGVVAASLQCTVLGAPCVATNPTPVAQSDRRYKYSVKIATSTLPAGATIVMAVPGDGLVTAAAGYTFKDATPVTVAIDSAAPVGGRVVFYATAGASTTFVIPPALCVDFVSSASAIRLTGAVQDAAAGRASVAGFVFTSGLQGAAAIAGGAGGVPASNNPVRFFVTCEDEAGNTATGVVEIKVSPAATTPPTLSVDATTLAYTEGTFATGVAPLPNAAFTGTTGAMTVTVVLEKPETSADASGGVEQLSSPSALSGTSCVATAYAVDSVTGFGSLSTTCTSVTATAVQAWLRQIVYINTRKVVTTGNRVVRAAVSAQAASSTTTFNGYTTSYDSRAIVAMASRTVRVTAVNNVPIVSFSSAAVPAWTEASGADVLVYAASPTLADADDSNFNGASLQIATSSFTLTTGGVAVTACDSARDALYLPLDYAVPYAPKVSGQWIASSCTLVLTPIAPATYVAQAALLAAVNSVYYTNLDAANPTNFNGNAAVNKLVTLAVTDSANSGAAGLLPATSVLGGTTDASTAKAFAAVAATDAAVLSVTPFDNDAIANYTSVYAQGGLLYSADPYAKSKEFVVGSTSFRVAKFPFPVAPFTTGSQTFTVTFNLAPATVAGTLVKGSIAGGAIFDADTATVSTASVALTTVNSAVSASSAVTLDATNTFVTVLTLSVTVDRAAVLAAANSLAGELAFTLTVSGLSISFYGDVLVQGCTDENAAAQLVTVSGNSRYVQTYAPFTMISSCSDSGADSCTDARTYFYGSSAAQALASNPTQPTGVTASSVYVATASAANVAIARTFATAWLTRFYPTNTRCYYAPVTVSASSNTTAVIGRGGFATADAAAVAAVAALVAAGATTDQQIAALAAVREANVGSFQISVPPSSVVGAGSIPITADQASTTVLTLLAASTSTAGVQTNVAIKLGPPGATFSQPVTVCIYVGDTAAGTFSVLVAASQKDSADESKGYTDFTTLQDQSFNRATGKLCGTTTHFSVFAPLSKPVLVNPTVPKRHLMGGSCPNACSGHGACRQDGRCVCFAGFTSYDCSDRACPSSESWGEDQSTMHSQSECSGRGVCERSTGICSCFTGYEGSACERVECPNACSGHGKCRKLAELPAVQAAGYASWEVNRMQVCQCDGGYTGADCSERVCPTGDDPETTCWQNTVLGVSAIQRQVQTLSLSFVDPTGTAAVDTATDEFALVFQGYGGRNFTTPRIENVWDAAAAPGAISNALRALPEYAVTDVSVALDSSAAPPAGSTAALSRSFTVTFTGATNSGNELLLQCPINAAGTMGCAAKGCRPAFKQLRIFDTGGVTLSSGVGLALNATSSVLLQPPAVTCADATLCSAAQFATAATPLQWGVQTTLTLYKATVGTTAYYSYEFTATKVYGADGSLPGSSYVPATVRRTPVPPSVSSTSPVAIAGPYGLVLNLNDPGLFISASTPAGSNSVTFSWRLPTCAVTQTTAAEDAYEKAPCANRGLCDTTTGECRCFTGYAGYNCAQQTVYV